MSRLITGRVVGLLIGIVLGVLVSQNFYEYHAIARDESPQELINEQHWVPAGGGPTGLAFYRRPRFRIG